MSPFARVNPGDLIQAQNLNQVVGSLNGTSGQGVPITQTSVNDATNYALSVQNLEVTNSRALNVLKSDGSLLIRADVNGVNLGNTTITGPTLTVPNASIGNAKLASDVGRASLLTNGGFEIWQRGTSGLTSAFTADRWQTAWGAGASMTVNRDTANADTAGGSNYCAAYAYTHGSAQTNVYNTVENVLELRNRTVTLSIRIKCSVASAIRARIWNGSVEVLSAFHTGDGTYQTLTVTTTVPSGSNALYVGVALFVSGTYYLDNAMLVVGTQPADYVPLHPADDLARCLRYYEVIASNSGVIATAQALSATQFQAMLRFRTYKAVTPTLTQGATQTLNAGGSPQAVTATSVIYADIYGCGYNNTVASGLVAGNATNWSLASSGQSIQAEANP